MPTAPPFQGTYDDFDGVTVLFDAAAIQRRYGRDGEVFAYDVTGTLTRLMAAREVADVGRRGGGGGAADPRCRSRRRRLPLNGNTVSNRKSAEQSSGEPEDLVQGGRLPTKQRRSFLPSHPGHGRFFRLAGALHAGLPVRVSVASDTLRAMELYERISEFTAALRAAGLAADADGIDESVAAGSTGSEILMAVRFRLGELLDRKLPVGLRVEALRLQILIAAALC